MYQWQISSSQERVLRQQQLQTRACLCKLSQDGGSRLVLENKYAEEGPNVAVSFGPGKCRKHIFHEGCVKDGRVSRCPLCRGAKKALKRVDMKKLSKLASPIIKAKPAKVTKKKSPTKKVAERKRCPNGTRKNKKTGECEEK